MVDRTIFEGAPYITSALCLINSRWRGRPILLRQRTAFKTILLIIYRGPLGIDHYRTTSFCPNETARARTGHSSCLRSFFGKSEIGFSCAAKPHEPVIVRPASFNTRYIKCILRAADTHRAENLIK